MNAPTRVTGRIAIHPRGFGFLNLETTPPSSAFIVPPDLNPYLDGDVVKATLETAPDGRTTARQLELVQRDRSTIVGEVIHRQGKTWLRMEKDLANTDWPLLAGKTPPPHGTHVITRLVGDKLELVRAVTAEDDLPLERIIARYGIPVTFTPAALEDASVAHKKVHAATGRRDLRDIPTVTIDAPSTRDIDDAISVLPPDSQGAIRLLVSIADVGEFVVADSALDKEARARGTSTYLAGRVLHMLPETLAADHISLLPAKDRLCLTIEMRIDPEGVVTAVDVHESIIRSWARLNYDEVAAWLARHEVSAAMEPVRQVMPWFRAAFTRLGIARMRRGGVVVERDEARITFDPATRAPIGIEAAVNNDAHQLIEHFMVAANEGIARWMHERGVPAPFRVHDQPTAETVAQLELAARNFGFEAAFGGRITPLALAAFDRQVAGAPSEPALRSVLRRSLGPARYTVEPLPHFGLGAPLYLHFTSPIRRYADLVVHRGVKAYLRGQRDFAPRDPAVETVAQHINHCAARSARAETQRQRMLEARLLDKRRSEVFDARITRIRPFGLIVQLDRMLVEGLVPNEALGPGTWTEDASATAMVSGTSRHAIGSAVRVKVSSVDEDLGRVEFAFA